jgi:hypothetical protein
MKTKLMKLANQSLSFSVVCKSVKSQAQTQLVVKFNEGIGFEQLIPVNNRD